MLPVLQIGPLTLQTAGLILILGLWAALTAVERFAKRNRQDSNAISNLTLIALAAGLIGARLSYAGANFEAFSGAWGSLFSLTPTMLDPLGGLAAGLIAALIYGQRKKLELWPTLDSLTPGFGILLIFMGLADLASGRAFGIPTSLPWGIGLGGETRHPTQIYASLAALATLLVFHIQQRRAIRPEGVLFLTWLSLTALLRILLEPLRADSVIWGQGLRAAQFAGWLILAVALVLFGRRYRSEPVERPATLDEAAAGGEK